MAEPTTSEQFLRTGAQEISGETPPIDPATGLPNRRRESHVHVVSTDAYLKRQREKDIAADERLRAMSEGIPGLKRDAINRLVLQFDSGQRTGVEQALDRGNRLLEGGVDNLTTGEIVVAESDVMDALMNSRMQATFRSLTAPARQAVMEETLRSPDYERFFNLRLREIAGREVNPPADQVTNAADMMRTNLMDTGTFRDEARRRLIAGGNPTPVAADITIEATRLRDVRNRRVATEHLIQFAIANEKNTIRAGLGTGAPVPSDADLTRQAREALLARGALMPADAQINTVMGAMVNNDPRFSQEALEIVARQDIVRDNQRDIRKDLNNIFKDTIHDLQRDHIETALAVKKDRVALGNAVCERRLQEIKRTVSTFNPDAYRPNGQAMRMFNELRNGGVEAFFRDDDDFPADQDALRALRQNPELRQRMQQELINELGMARMNVERPPMQRSDFYSIFSMMGGSNQERTRQVGELLRANQNLKDYAKAAEDGGIIQRGTYDRLISAMKKGRVPAAITVSLLAALFGTVAVPPLAAVPLIGGVLLGYQRLTRHFMDNDASGRRYEEPNY